jgi:YspA, cpYpsA-related SLOG family
VIYIALICGDRNWGDSVPITREIKRLIKEHGTQKLLILEGGAPGADTLAKIVAHDLNVHVAEVSALWPTRHRAAGPSRNEMMLAIEPDEVIAYHPDIKKSRGTKHMVNIARKAGIPTKVVSK